jgi:hypothetical protein
MDTTIQVSTELRETLQNKKFWPKESYEKVIWDLIEDTSELSEETKMELAKAREEIRRGKYKPLSKVKKELGL